MKKYYKFLNTIISLDLPINIETNILRQHIPSISETFTQKEDVHIVFSEDNNSKILYDLECLVIHDNWNDIWSNDITHLIYSYLKYIFFHKEIYFVHSCLINGKLLIGASGSGKTTLCIEAMKEKLEVSSLDRTCVIFNDKNLISLAGTDIISVRIEEIQPSLVIHNSSGDRNLYQYNLSTKNNIHSISLFQINTNLKKIKIEGLSIVHQLFPFFIDSIKSDCFVQNGRLLFSPNYCELKKKKLFRKLKNLTIPVYFTSGNIHDIIGSQENDTK